MLPAGYLPVRALRENGVAQLQAQQRKDAGGQDDEQQQAEGERGRGAHAVTLSSRRLCVRSGEGHGNADARTVRPFGEGANGDLVGGGKREFIGCGAAVENECQ